MPNNKSSRSRLLTLLSALLFLLCTLSSLTLHASTGPNDDFDGDTVINSSDIDHDNDGILNTMECQAPFVPKDVEPIDTGSSDFAVGVGHNVNLNYTVPAGENRVTLVVVTTERDKCLLPTSNDEATPSVSLNGQTSTLQREDWAYVDNYLGNSGMRFAHKVYALWESELQALSSPTGDFQITGLGNPGCAQDETIVSAITYQNVYQKPDKVLSFTDLGGWLELDEDGSLGGDRWPPPGLSLTWNPEAAEQPMGSSAVNNALFLTSNVSLGTQTDSITVPGTVHLRTTAPNTAAGSPVGDRYDASEHDGAFSAISTLSGVSSTTSVSLDGPDSFRGMVRGFTLVSSGVDCVDTDGDGIDDYLDLDSDNDGIPDNIEAQTTAGYTAPASSYSTEGVNTAYGTGLTPADTDSDSTPDYLDLDSDNDTAFDAVESGLLGAADIDATGKTTGTVGANGWDNALYAADDYADVNSNLDTPATQLTDSDGDVSGAVPMVKDLDYRDAHSDMDGDGVSDTSDQCTGFSDSDDADSDGVPDGCDLDDDNDGIIDSVEKSCATFNRYDSSSNTVGEFGTYTTSGNVTLWDGDYDPGDITYEGVPGHYLSLNDLGDIATLNLYDNVNDTRIVATDFEDESAYFRIYDANGSLIEDITPYVTHQGTNFSTVNDGGAGQSLLIESDQGSTNTGSTRPRGAIILDFPFIVSKIEIERPAGTPTGSTSFSLNGGCQEYDTDSDSIPNHLDLDSDNDGIPDNIEAQTTKDYIAPSPTSNDSDNNGLDDIYESGDFAPGGGLTPVDTDGSISENLPDYLDLDSDNDGVFDLLESGLTVVDGNTDGKTDSAVGDNGWDDTLDATDDYSDPNANLETPSTQLTDSDGDVSGNVPMVKDLDYRDADIDIDRDGIASSVDIDDDNDGILDVDESYACVPAGTNFIGPDYFSHVTLSNVSPVTVYVASQVPLEDYWIDGDTTTGRNSFSWTDTTQPVRLEFELHAPLSVDGFAVANDYGKVGTGDGIREAVVYLYDDTGTLIGTESFPSLLNNDSTVVDNYDLSKLYENVARFVIEMPWTGPGTGPAKPAFQMREIGLFTSRETCLPLDSDSDGIINSLDLDSDNDGIPDNIEAQTTKDYIAPSMTSNDSNNNGLGDIYETGDFATGEGLTPVDTDGDGTNDYLDLDSDNDDVFDLVESGLTVVDANTDGKTDSVVGANGWDDTLDDYGDPNANLETPSTQLADTDGDVSGNVPLEKDLDYRDAVINIDSDGDGIYDEDDIDDDNDGILDSEEGGICAGVVPNVGISVNGSEVTNSDTTSAIHKWVDGSIANTNNYDAGYTASSTNDEDITLTYPLSFNASNFTLRIHNDWGGDNNEGIASIGAVKLFDESGTLIKEVTNISYGDGNADTVFYDIPAALNAQPVAAGAQSGTAADDVIDIAFGPVIGVHSIVIDDYVQQPLEGAGQLALREIELRLGTLLDSETLDLTTAGYCGKDSDGDGFYDHLDLDSDNDGIPDNIEAQTSAGYIAPSGDDANKNGMDDAYDAVGTLTPVDTDSDGTTDYLDLDSDNDGLTDLEESGLGLSGDAEGRTTGTVGLNGWDDSLEDAINKDNYVDVNGQIDDPRNGSISLTDADNDVSGNVPMTEDLDYRDTEIVLGYTISGYVFEDSNVSGILESGEGGISGVTVVLHDTDNNVCRSVKSGAKGYYYFEYVENSDYTLYEAANETVIAPTNCPPTLADPTDYGSSTPNQRSLTVLDADMSNQNFGDVRAPRFELDHQKTAAPHTLVTHPHVFTTPVAGSVSFSIAEQVADPANLPWGTGLMQDMNCDAQLDGDDIPLVNPLVVSAGDKLCLLVKVMTPANASSGALHTMSVQSDFAFAGSSSLANIIQQHTDLTRVIGPSAADLHGGIGQLALTKTVWNMTRGVDGTVALPGEELRYTITYENVGTGPLNELSVHDSVPEFTKLVTGSLLCTDKPADLPLCAVNDDVNGSLHWKWSSADELQAGSKGSVSYRVTVE